MLDDALRPCDDKPFLPREGLSVDDEIHGLMLCTSLYARVVNVILSYHLPLPNKYPWPENSAAMSRVQDRIPPLS